MNSDSRCRTPRLGSLTWGSEPSLPWVDFCGISVRQSVSHPPTSYGIWFYSDCAPPTISLWLLLCLWMWGIFFGEFQCPPVDDCPAASCDSGVLTRGSESTSFYSTILVPPPGGHSSSRCTGLSLLQPLLLWSTGSRRTGSVVVAHGPSCSTACEIFPDQGSNLCPLHWQADSQPLRHQGIPILVSFITLLHTVMGFF